ncbi:MAG TPA: zf-HC2 domain-containing protein [Streptosporangiaceae bacterium]|nr:zf-HC2 domain-containing protein [Streptosporangiaceae bacterium]
MTQQQSWECGEVRISLGVYVLGAIDPAERAVVDAHLATCRECRDELAGLASLPALLARVGPEELSRIEAGVAQPDNEEAPPELVGAVLDLAAARRKRTRWRYLTSAAAVVAVLGGVFGGVAATRSSAPTTQGTVAGMLGWWGSGPWDRYSAVSHVSGASANVYLTNQKWGTGIGVSVSGIAVGTTCDLFATLKDGQHRWVASWTTSYDEGTVGYTGSLSVGESDIASMAIVASGKTLLTVPTPN